MYIAQGRKVVLPLVAPGDLSPADAAAWVPTPEIDVTLGHDVALRARVYRVMPAPTTDRLAPARWLAPGPSWNAEPPSAEVARRPGVWVAVTDAPTGLGERSLPAFARVGDRAIELTWIPPARQNPDIARAPMPQVSAESLRALGDLLRPEAVDPQRRWRVRLLVQRIEAGALWGDLPPAGFGGATSGMPEPLEATADQLELNARAAIDALRRADAPLALEVVARLTAVIRTSDGVLLPAWAGGGEGTESLMAQLLHPGRGAGEKIEAARRWLAALPAAQAWIIDDVGSPPADGPRRHIVTAGVCDLSGKGGQTLALSSNSFAGRDGEVALAPFHTAALRAPMPVLDGDAQGRPTIDVTLGGFAASLAPIAGMAPVSPPGFTLGPLLEPWTLATWRDRRAIPAGDDRGGSVLIQRSSTGSWEAAVTCPPGEERTDELRLWLGAFGAARGVISVSPARGCEFRAEPGAAPMRLDCSVVRREDGGWQCVLALPGACFEHDGSLIVGVERFSEGGFRGSFPRPMMPGQAEPGRIRLDLSAWDRAGGTPE